MNGNNGIFNHWIRTQKPKTAILSIAATISIFIIAAWLIMLIATSTHRKMTNILNPPQTMVISDTEAELHILNNLLEHLIEQHQAALKASRRDENSQTRAQQLVVASEIEGFMREVVEAMNARLETKND